MAMVDIPADILASLVCSKCEQLLKKGPVYQQHDGAAVCGLCQAREEAQPASRCLLYEATAQLLQFPCRYQEEGCPTTVPFVAADTTDFTHEDACEYRQYVCPVLGSNRCDWAGRRNQLLQHSEEQHPDRVLSNPALITPNIRRSETADFIISAFHLLFLLHTRVCVSTAKLHYAVRLLGDPQKASNYTFTLTIQRGDDILTRSRDVLPQGVLALQEHSALNFCTNSLLSVLGGWDGASLSVEVKARGPQAETEQEQAQRSQAEQDREQCGKCTVSTPRLYRVGWLCASCVPRKWPRSNKGCNFEDIGERKRNKHSAFFCQRRTRCYLCKAVLKPGKPWQQHYLICSYIKVIPTGSRFLVRHNNRWQEQWFLVETAAGHVLCKCYYTQRNFTLDVHTPVPCGQLHLHRCEVRLECAGNTQTHTPDTIYDSMLDWALDCKNDKFFTNPEVHVHLQVCQNY